MSDTERDTKFAEFARLHYPELSQLFFTMYARMSEQRPIEEIDAVEDEIKTLIARRAYDLVRHAIYCNGISSHYWPNAEFFGQASAIYESETDSAMHSIPDLTDLPPL